MASETGSRKGKSITTPSLENLMDLPSFKEVAMFCTNRTARSTMASLFGQSYDLDRLREGFPEWDAVALCAAAWCAEHAHNETVRKNARETLTAFGVWWDRSR